MHEIGIAQEVLNAVFDELKNHECSKVKVIELTVGEFNMLSQESLHRMPMIIRRFSPKR